MHRFLLFNKNLNFQKNQYFTSIKAITTKDTNLLTIIQGICVILRGIGFASDVSFAWFCHSGTLAVKPVSVINYV